jgi:hypothetical protein
MSPVGSYPVSVHPTLTSNTGDVYVVDAIVPGTLIVQPDPPPTPKFCWQGQLLVQITKPAPDPFHWTGAQISGVGVSCSSVQPGTAQGCKTTIASEGLPAGTLVPDQIARFLLNHVGADSFAVILTDQVSPVHSAGTCTLNDGTCAGAPPATVSAFPGSVGAIITAG